MWNELYDGRYIKIVSNNPLFNWIIEILHMVKIRLSTLHYGTAEEMKSLRIRKNPQVCLQLYKSIKNIKRHVKHMSQAMRYVISVSFTLVRSVDNEWTVYVDLIKRWQPRPLDYLGSKKKKRGGQSVSWFHYAHQYAVCPPVVENWEEQNRPWLTLYPWMMPLFYYTQCSCHRNMH